MYNQNLGYKGERSVDKSRDFRLKCTLERQFTAQISTKSFDSLESKGGNFWFYVAVKGQLRLRGVEYHKEHSLGEINPKRYKG